MSQQELMQNPPFQSVVRASGAAEVWTHSNEDHKMRQFGWRCTNSESHYKTKTLIGNWSEERFDIDERKVPECLPSQHGHYFDSVNSTSYNTIPKCQVPEPLKGLKERAPNSFPSHQPEVDSDQMKSVYNSWKTTQRGDYLHPQIRQQPLKL